MTMDTEGSELDLVLDFPWDEFDVRIVQIEQLVESKYTAQRGRKDKILKHLEKFGYKLLSVYGVDPYDTDDLILTRNVDEFLAQTPQNQRDGDYTEKRRTNHQHSFMAQTNERDQQLLKQIISKPVDQNDPMQRRKFLAYEALKERRKNQSP